MHIPVLKDEAIQLLDVKPNENFIDATCGRGGHLTAILEKNGPKGKVLGIDRSPEQIESCKLKTKEYKDRTILVHDSFSNIKDIADREKLGKVSGILFDLGISSWHLEGSGRGFTFQRKEPLDMRFDTATQLTAEKIVNLWSRPEIAKILKDYGEERFADSIAREIIAARQVKHIENTQQLVEVIKRAVPGFYKRQRLHFATKTFQALRIAVNDELGEIERTLPKALETLDKDGRLVIISFHSFEDRMVKNFFKEQAGLERLQILTKKPVVSSFSEAKANPRARSAKLRAGIKINNN